MKNEIAMYAAVALLVGLGIGYGIGTRPHPHPEQVAANANAPATMEEMMHDMNAALRGKTGDDFDKAFLSEMIVHHQGAVDMAQLALKDAKHQEIKDLAEAIITAQKKEIAEMRDWQSDWYGGSGTVPAMHDADGMHE